MHQHPSVSALPGRKRADLDVRAKTIAEAAIKTVAAGLERRESALKALQAAAEEKHAKAEAIIAKAKELSQ